MITTTVGTHKRSTMKHGVTQPHRKNAGIGARSLHAIQLQLHQVCIVKFDCLGLGLGLGLWLGFSIASGLWLGLGYDNIT